MSGALFIKNAANAEHSSDWICANFQLTALKAKESGTWQDVSGAFVKDGGTWKQVYPSTSTAWTSYAYAGTAENTAFPSGTKPDLSTNPSYAPSNLQGATNQCRWEDDIDGWGEPVDLHGHSFSPLSTAGNEYGAINRFKVTLDIAAITDIDWNSCYASVNIGSSIKSSADVWSSSPSFSTFTFDYTTASWLVADESAGKLANGDDTGILHQVYPHYGGTAASSNEVAAIRNVQLQYNYTYN